MPEGIENTGLGLGVGEHHYDRVDTIESKLPIGQIALAAGLSVAVTSSKVPKAVRVFAVAGAVIIGLNAKLVWDAERVGEKQLRQAIGVSDRIRELDPRRSA